MPEQRLQRTRDTLPRDYQFGDAVGDRQWPDDYLRWRYTDPAIAFITSKRDAEWAALFELTNRRIAAGLSLDAEYINCAARQALILAKLCCD